jgi:GH24 family phage-related lysozyme (muramidase)
MVQEAQMKTFKQYIEESYKKNLAAGLLSGAAIMSGIVSGAKTAGVGRYAPAPTGEPVSQQVEVEIPQTQTTTNPKTPESKIHHDEIRKMVMQDEGVKLTPYKCTSGKLTVGCGHNLEAPGSKDVFNKVFGEEGAALHAHALSGKPITRDQADKLFDADYGKHLQKTINMIPDLDKHPANVQAALVSGTYRGHVGGSPKFRKLFNAGKYTEAADELLDNAEYKSSATAKGVKNRMSRDANIIRDYGKSKNVQ